MHTATNGDPHLLTGQKRRHLALGDGPGTFNLKNVSLRLKGRGGGGR